MPGDPFRSSWEKLERAEVHMVELAERIEDFGQDMTAAGRLMFEFDVHYNSRSRCLVYSLSAIEHAPVEWGVVLGDILHNLRSALDHLAWTLVARGKRPIDTLSRREQNAVKFPIYKSRQEFNSAIRPTGSGVSCLPGVGRVPLALIRTLQPYRGGKRADFHPFAVLQTFSNYDKHRVIQLAFHRPYDPAVTLGMARDFVPTRTKVAKIIPPEPGAEILRIYGRRTGSSPYVAVQIDSSAEVAIDGKYWLADVYSGARRLIVAALYRLAPVVR